MVEPADFVHLFDVNSNFKEAQEIDLFGEIAGVSFSPDSDVRLVHIHTFTHTHTHTHTHTRTRTHRKCVDTNFPVYRRSVAVYYQRRTLAVYAVGKWADACMVGQVSGRVCSWLR